MAPQATPATRVSNATVTQPTAPPPLATAVPSADRVAVADGGRVIATNALFGYAGSVGVVALRLAAKVVLIRSLDPADFGRVITTQNVQALVVMVAGLGIGDAVVRFVGLYTQDGTGRTKGVVQQAVRFAVLLGTLATLLLLASAGALASRFGLGAQGGWGISLAAFAIVPILLGDILGDGFRGLNRTWVKVVVLDLSRGVATLSGYVLLASLGWATYTGAVSVQLLAALVSVGFITIAFRRTRDFAAPGQRVGLSDLLAYSVPLFVSVLIGGTLVGSGIPLALAAQHPPEVVAVYAIALTIAPLLQLPATALENAALPVWAAAVGTQGKPQLVHSFTNVARWGLILGLLLFVPLATAPGECLTLLFGNQYAGATGVVEVALAATLLAVVVGPTEGMLLAFGLTRAILVARLVSGVIALAAVWPLVRAWGVMGAIIAWGASTVISNTVGAFYLFRVHGIQPFDFRFRRTMIVGIIGLLVSASMAATDVEGLTKLAIIIAANTSTIALLGLLLGAWHPTEITRLVRQSQQVVT